MREVTHSQVLLPPHRFWVTASGSGTPVVLLHGLGGSSEWWGRNIAALGERHRVYALDLVGFGRNRFFIRRSSLPLMFEETAELLARWIGSELQEPVHLVGNSMGGHIAIHLAARRPDLVRSLTLVDATGIPFELSPRPHLENFAIPAGLLSFTRVMARDLFRAGPASFAVAFSRLLRDDARPLMRTLQMPVLLLWGEVDSLVPLPYAQRMAEEIPHARLTVIPRAGHVPMWDAPEAFDRALLAFLEEVDATAEHRSSMVPRRFSWPVAGRIDGIAHREAGTRRTIVLVHGLGVSSSYFERFAHALFARGWDPIAPDIPGFGESGDAPAAGPRQHAEWLAAWGEKHGIEDAVWLGHSTGCNAVAHLAEVWPRLVKRCIFVSPIWTDRGAAAAVGNLLSDVPREPLRLIGVVVRGYWRCGLLRWLATFRRHLPDMQKYRPRQGAVIAAARDPFLDVSVARAIDPQAKISLPGAHAVHFSHPEETADAVSSAV